MFYGVRVNLVFEITEFIPYLPTSLARQWPLIRTKDEIWIDLFSNICDLWHGTHETYLCSSHPVLSAHGDPRLPCHHSFFREFLRLLWPKPSPPGRISYPVSHIHNRGRLEKYLDRLIHYLFTLIFEVLKIPFANIVDSFKHQNCPHNPRIWKCVRY